MTPTDHKAVLRKLAAEDGCEASLKAADYIEYLERRLKGDLIHLTATEVAVAKKLGMSIEEYAKNKLEIMCNPPAPIRRGRKPGSKNKPKPVPVVEKPARKPRAKK